MLILVGCPIYQRAWILEDWFDHLELQGHRLKYVFAYTTGWDRTFEILQRRAPHNRMAFWPSKDAPHSTTRRWTSARYDLMAKMRNDLLTVAREANPDFYLSLDSDILLPPGALDSLIDAAQTYDAVAPLAYLGPGKITNAFTGTPGKHYRRAPVYGAVQTVDVICAAKLMTPKIFNDDKVYYYGHPQGEDLGWSATARANGYRLALDTRVLAKHVMEPKQLNVVDRRIGW